MYVVTVTRYPLSSHPLSGLWVGSVRRLISRESVYETRPCDSRGIADRLAREWADKRIAAQEGGYQS